MDDSCSCDAGHDHAGGDGERLTDGGTASGGATSASHEGVRLSVPEMDCPSCAATVGRALDPLDVPYETSPTTGQVRLARGADTERAVAAIERAGYPVEAVLDGDERADLRPEPVWRSSRALKTALATVFALPALVLLLLGVDGTVLTLGGVGFSAADLLFAASVVAGGEVILRGGWRSLRTLSLDIDFLMSAAVLSAVAVTLLTPETLWVEAASLAVLFNVAELLERYSVDRARASLADLFDRSPETALVERDGERRELPVEAVRVGERVVVEPGAKVPLDGQVVDGESAVDQAPVTGESVPVDKTVGDEVYAGTMNGQGYLEVEVSRPAEESTLARVIDLVEGAQERRTDREQFVERFAAYYTPVVTALAVLVATVPPLVFGAPAVEWLINGIGLLVIACPCAFVISTPVTVVSGVTSAARNGVLVKGGDHLEAMGEVDTVALDKTGTLTTGELSVTDVVPLNGATESDVLRCARGLEARSEHPIAAAVTARAEAEPTGTPHPGEAGVSGFESLTGQGVRADLAGRTHYAGSPALFEELGFELDHVHFTTETGELPVETRERCERGDCLDLVRELVPRLQSEGKTVVLVGTDDEVEGVIAVADTVRPEARETVAALADRGLRTVMLTGDNERTARAVADELGIDDVRAGLLPEDKSAAIEALQTEGRVAFVGDGINDAPALATADVGIAMGAAGSDAAIETADIALLADDVTRLPYLVDLSQRATRVIRQNVYTSLGVKALLAVLIPVLAIPLWAVVLLGDVGMTTLVTGNAMRLARLRPS